MEGKLRALFITRRSSGGKNDGDNVVTSRLVRLFEEKFSTRLHFISKVNNLGRLRNFLRIWPPEVTAYYSNLNRISVQKAIAEWRPHIVVVDHEALFPLVRSGDLKLARTSIFVCHNAISRLAATDPAWLVRQLAPCARKFELQFYPEADWGTLVVLSRGDADWVVSTLGDHIRCLTILPGAPKSTPLSEGAKFIQAVEISGSYGWWRKRRDLTHYLRKARSKSVVTDTEYVISALGENGVARHRPRDVRHEIGIGLITDRFLGGFKLKATEYVAMNCAIVSLCDIRSEFAGLPHADKFVHWCHEPANVAEVVKSLASLEPNLLATQFAEFKDAVLQRFGWDANLDLLHSAILRTHETHQ